MSRRYERLLRIPSDQTAPGDLPGGPTSRADGARLRALLRARDPDPAAAGRPPPPAPAAPCARDELIGGLGWLGADASATGEAEEAFLGWLGDGAEGDRDALARAFGCLADGLGFAATGTRRHAELRRLDPVEERTSAEILIAREIACYRAAATRFAAANAAIARSASDEARDLRRRVERACRGVARWLEQARTLKRYVEREESGSEVAAELLRAYADRSRESVV